MGAITWLNEHEGLAGWMGAVAAFAAIVFAWWQGQRAWQQAERRRIDDRTRFLHELQALANAAAAQLSHVKDCVENRWVDNVIAVRPHCDDLNGTFARVRELPVKEWPSPFLCAAVDRLADAFSIAVQAIDLYLVTAGVEPVDELRRRQFINSVDAYQGRLDEFATHVSAVSRLD